MAMIKDDELISVRNRNNGETWYQIDDKIQIFAKDEVKKVPFQELRQLNYTEGGKALLSSKLVIENKDALRFLNMEVEPEYFYDEADIRLLLFNGSYDEFADFLDFAPEGAIEIAKNLAVKEQIPDVRKREMLGKKTGLNINNAIMVNEIMNEDSEKEVKEEAPKRRVAPATTSEAPTRRVSSEKIVIKK